MKRIIPRVAVVLGGLLTFAVGMTHKLPWAIGAGIFIAIFALMSVIEAELYNRARWQRMLTYYVKEKNRRESAERAVELVECDLEDTKEKLKEAEAKPSMIYVGGFPQLTDALNKAHARNMARGEVVE